MKASNWPVSHPDGLHAIESKARLRWHEAAILAVAAVVALLWPALLNGGPFWSPDTSHYIRAADAAFVSVTGTPSEWSDRLIIVTPEGRPSQDSSEATRSGGAEKTKIIPTRTVLTGRSIYYGLFMYLPLRILGPWAAILTQAGFVVITLFYVLATLSRVTRLGVRAVIVGAVACCALFTPLPYFTSMLMPDVYAGLIILTMATSICFWKELLWTERVVLIGLSSIMATFHTTHVLIVVAMAGMAALIFFRGKERLRPFLLTAPVAATALLAGALFSYAVKAQLGHGPISPPFLSARIIASGTGAAYLNRHCGNVEGDFALCRYRHRFPIESDGFLWSKKPNNGLFQIVNFNEQREIAEEDKAFFLSVIKDDPLSFLALAAQATARALGMFGLSGFNYPEVRTMGFLHGLPQGIAEEIARSGAARQVIPTAVAVKASVLLTAASFCVALVLAWRLAKGTPSLFGAVVPERLRNYLFLCALAVLANAAICGVLSKPAARYQMRIIWVLPVAALVLPFSFSLSRRRPSLPA